VADTGIGMTDEEIGQAVKPFVQIENWLARKYEGVGLGLSITKAYCELHGGELRIESEPGKGTRATIWLPGTRLYAHAPSARALH
jgi:signal transduction histidine kinase